MSDPAIEAAQRYWRSDHPDGISIGAAREALKPLRELHFPSTRIPSPDFGQCVTCHTPWPSPTDRLIYPSEELS